MVADDNLSRENQNKCNYICASQRARVDMDAVPCHMLRDARKSYHVRVLMASSICVHKRPKAASSCLFKTFLISSHRPTITAEECPPPPPLIYRSF
jgi:hypothetical protein